MVSLAETPLAISRFCPPRMVTRTPACLRDRLSGVRSPEMIGWTASARDSALGPGAGQGCLGKIPSRILVLIPAPVFGGNLRHPVTDSVGFAN